MGKMLVRGNEQEAAYAAASNAWLTIMAGFTTVQNPGSSTAIPLRDAIAQADSRVRVF